MLKAAKVKIVIKNSFYFTEEELKGMVDSELAEWLLENPNRLLEGAEWEVEREYTTDIV